GGSGFSMSAALAAPSPPAPVPLRWPVPNPDRIPLGVYYASAATLALALAGASLCRGRGPAPEVPPADPAGALEADQSCGGTACRDRARAEVSGGLPAGRLTLREAADCFRALNATPPAVDPRRLAALSP